MKKIFTFVLAFFIMLSSIAYAEGEVSSGQTLVDKYWPLIYLVLIGALILLVVLAVRRMREIKLARRNKK